MKLFEILKGVQVIKMNTHCGKEITGVSDNSNEIGLDGLFIAVRGLSNDGNNYINDALAKGAAAVVTDREQKDSVPYVLVDDARKALALIAGNFYGNAHREMKIIALLGTNGKTTTTYMIADILKKAGKKVTVAGTLGAYIIDEKQECGLTTPDPIPLHRLMRYSLDRGAEYFIYEVSAHAVYWKKTEGIIADIAVFTNFSQDHLDFFSSMQEYADVKKSFFTPDKVRFAIVNADDPLGREIIKEKKVFLTSYGIHNPSDTFAIDIEYKGSGTSCLVNSCDDIFELSTNFMGEFNLYNTLAAVAAARALSIDADIIKKAYFKMQPVSGRFNIIESTKRVVVDFAHTPDGLKNLLSVARKICFGKLIAVFGCGGNRDPKKRSIMGKIAGELADFTILTSDNSRDEAPQNIISQIEQGIREVTSNYIKIVERENAITYALLLAKADDLVIIAGKGGEEYMEEHGIKRPYSDKKVVEEIFRRYNL